MKLFIERLKDLRYKKKMSIEKLSTEMCISSTTIRKWENGKSIPQIKNIRKLAIYFGVTADYLLGLED